MTGDVLLMNLEISIVLVLLLQVRVRQRRPSMLHDLFLLSTLRRRAIAVKVAFPILLALQRHINAAFKFLKAIDMMHASVLEVYCAIKRILYRTASTFGAFFDRLVGLHFLSNLWLLVNYCSTGIGASASGN